MGNNNNISCAVCMNFCMVKPLFEQYEYKQKLTLITPRMDTIGATGNAFDVGSADCLIDPSLSGTRQILLKMLISTFRGTVFLL